MLKAGVLGAGHLGKIHLRLLQESREYELVGFYDVNEEYGRSVEVKLLFLTLIFLPGASSFCNLRLIELIQIS